MKKVILNKSYGGFSLSSKAYINYANKLNKKLYIYKFNLDTQKYYLVNKKNINNKDSMNLLFLHYCFTNCGRVTQQLSNTIDLDNKYREDKTLIEVVEELGEEANTFASKLVVVEIPDDLDYMIDDYDGWETLHQKVQEW